MPNNVSQLFSMNFMMWCILCVFLITEQDYGQAVVLYTKAIDLNPFLAPYYGNRSFAYLKQELFGCALSDATKALDLDKTYLKVSLSCWNF